MRAIHVDINAWLLFLKPVKWHCLVKKPFHSYWVKM